MVYSIFFEPTTGSIPDRMALVLCISLAILAGLGVIAWIADIVDEVKRNG